ncbi:unannotated protein [freshwater metagenome]|uniref:Unannotated protein n=1 Tax=freshwater metagenome TaxID=449393 RepID=A0A6J7K3R7_9ZZZZ
MSRIISKTQHRSLGLHSRHFRLQLGSCCNGSGKSFTSRALTEFSIHSRWRRALSIFGIPIGTWERFSFSKMAIGSPSTCGSVSAKHFIFRRGSASGCTSMSFSLWPFGALCDSLMHLELESHGPVLPPDSRTRSRQSSSVGSRGNRHSPWELSSSHGPSFHLYEQLAMDRRERLLHSRLLLLP